MKLNIAKIDLQKLYQNSVAGLMDLKARSLQSIILFGSWIGAMGLNFLGSMLVTKLLGPAAYGDYKFVQTVWSLLALLSTIGLLQSGSRVVLLETEPSSAKQAIGVVLMIALILGAIIGLVTVIIAYPIDYLFHTHLALIFIILSPLVIGLTLRDALLLILQSTNQIALMAAIEFFPSMLYVIGIYSISKFTLINAGITLALGQVSLLGTALIIILVLRPRLGSVRHFIQKIKEENKKFGFPIYLGLIANYATSYVNRLGISYWVDNTAIGFFSLASTISEPLRLIPNAAAISSFRSFSKQEKISKNVFLFTIITSSLALLAALFLIGPVLSLFYPKGFSSVGPMARVLAFAAIAQGFGELFNRFLGAHGKGKKLRNASYLIGAVNISGFIVLTPLLGVNGAVITAVLAGLASVLFMYIMYRRSISGPSDLPREEN